MIGLSAFAAALVISLLASFTTIFYFHRRLTSILIELCGTPERARFWSAFSNLSLVLTPLIFSLFVFSEETAPEFSLPLLVGQLRLALIGLLLTVVALAIVVGSFISRAPVPVKSADYRAPSA